MLKTYYSIGAGLALAVAVSGVALADQPSNDQLLADQAENTLGAAGYVQVAANQKGNGYLQSDSLKNGSINNDDDDDDNNGNNGNGGGNGNGGDDDDDDD